MIRRSFNAPSDKKKLKKTRIWIIILALTSFSFSLAFLIIAQVKKNPVTIYSPVVKKPKQLPSFSWPFSHPEESKQSPEDLENIIMSVIGSEKDNWGIWIEELGGDFVWRYQADSLFPAASLIKLPITARFYQEMENGRFSLDDEWRLKEKDKLNGNGSLQYKSAGEVVSFEKLAFLSLNQSDNTALYIIHQNLGDKIVQQAGGQLGMNQTSFSNDQTSPADIALFFRKLYQGKILSGQMKDKFLSTLQDTPFDDQMPAGVPEGIIVSHKVGVEDNSGSDAGIIFVPHNPLLFVFLSKNTSPQHAKEIIIKLTREAYWYLLVPSP